MNVQSRPVPALALLACSVSALAACSFEPTVLESRSSADGGLTDAVEAPGPDASPDSGGGPADAGNPVPDAATCPDICDSCELETSICQIDCSGNLCPEGTDVACPEGWTCSIACTGSNACRHGAVTCVGDCEITCEGSKACERTPVTCSGPSCAVQCLGKDACRHEPVNCNATTCDLTCDGNNACDDSVCCSGDDCGDSCVASGEDACECDD